MKITVLSGGSGNDRLIKGLKGIYKNCDVKVITNMYDSGKSTGICRKVTDTLGVSDVRKNHSRLYKATKITDETIIEFYDNRYNLTKGKEVEEISNLLDKWGLDNFKIYVDRFFSRPASKDYIYRDFSIANIVYSEMYAELGYEKTNSIFCDLLGIDDFVIINSFDNLYLKAITESGDCLSDEGDIVEYCNPNDKIVSIKLDGNSTFGLNNKAINRIAESDLIVISTGTFWSSIYPTLYYKDFYTYINNSNATKIWAINNEEDKDAYGVTSNDFIDIVEKLGLNLSDFTILENLDSKDSLHLPNDKYNIVYKFMGNDRGKHNEYDYAKEILFIYYHLNDDYCRVMVDFDDTIWDRDYKFSPIKEKLSKDNVKLVSELSDYITIVSGNTYDSIYRKISKVFGTDLKGFNNLIWADSNCRCYKNNQVVDSLNYLSIDNDTYLEICKELEEVGLTCSIDNEEKIFNIKIKPLDNVSRKILVKYLNNYVLVETNYKAYIAGTTTIDIIHRKNTKTEVLKYYGYRDVLYIGDEIDLLGNDFDIARNSKHYISVSDIEETTAVLKLLKDKYGIL